MNVDKNNVQHIAKCVWDKMRDDVGPPQKKNVDSEVHG